MPSLRRWQFNSASVFVPITVSAGQVDSGIDFVGNGETLLEGSALTLLTFGNCETADSLYFTGTSDDAPLSFTKNTRNLAGLVSLAFFETTWTSSGDS